MASKDIVGYVVMENDDTYREVKNLEVIDKPNLFYCRFETILQSLDCMNRNRREYNGQAMVESLSHPIVQELIANNKFKGEYSHPIGLPLQRIKVVDEKCTSHRVIRWWRDKNLIRGIVETLDDGIWGTKMTKSILQGENPSFSYRGFAEIVNKNGHEYVPRPPFTVAYDEVNTPSHVEAYALPKKTFVSQGFNGNSNTKDIMSGQMVTESTGGWVYPVTIQDMRDLVSHGDSSLAPVLESFDIPINSIIGVSPTEVIARRRSSTFHLTPTEKAQREIAYYMSSLR